MSERLRVANARLVSFTTIINPGIASESQSNWSIDDSSKIKPIMFDEDEIYPEMSDIDSQRNRYHFVGEEWRLSQIDGKSFSLDLQINESNSTSNASSIPAKGDAVWSCFYTGCLWLPINHISFQFAHVFLCLSYLAPPGLYGLIYLRLVLAIGSALLAAWACFIICAFDTFIWNSLFLLVNAVHAVVLIISMRTVHFGPQMEQVYGDIFQPLKVSKRQFKAVAKCLTSIRLMKRGECFSVEKETKVETLSLLLSGRMLVSQNDKMLHFIHPMQFLDSSDWFQVSSDDIFQVREKVASYNGSPLFKTNLVNNMLFVESEKPLNLLSAFNPKNANKVDKSLENAYKLLQIKQELADSQQTISNPMNTL
ncbi:putative Blood vessel epicardial substance [Daphnia magna]|uniref:Putative Blood vessel epicardial substance n=1 Tax=Daphnia magna TaxID=35525 RepID=A0A164Y186_9CRUS|nr:putative Blood vessel epicardial substance [Daphnia magna]